MGNGGDTIFSVAGNALIQQLNVLEEFAVSTFFNAGVAVHSVLAHGRTVLLGCESGHILEVARLKPQTGMLRRLELGAPVRIMDADPSGGRVLAVGDDRLAVWSSLPSGRLSGSEKPAPVTADISCTVTGMLSALLLPGGGAEDYLVAGPSGLMRGPHQEPWRGSDPGAEALGTVAPDL